MDVRPRFTISTSSKNDDESREIIDTISPNKVAKFANVHKCPQYFANEFTDKTQQSSPEPDEFRYSNQPLSLLYQVIGDRFENSVMDFYNEESEATFLSQQERREERTAEEWERISEQGEWKFLRDILREVESNDKKVIAADELRVTGDVEVWGFHGFADLVFVWNDDGELRVRIIELKSGFEKQSSHHIQLGIYAHLIRHWMMEIGDNEGWKEDDWKVDATVINRTDTLTSHPDRLDTISLIPVKTDIYNLTREGGILENEYEKEQEEVDYQLDSKCQSCEYAESCYTQAVETASLSLLGLSRQEQQSLEKIGITSIHDLAALARKIPESERDPGDHIDLEGRVSESDYHTVHTEIPNRVDTADPVDLIEHAQVILSEFEENEFGEVGNVSLSSLDKDATWRSGSGYGNLPTHDDEMVRVYLHVEHDHRYDRLCTLSAHITAPSINEPKTVSQVVDVPSQSDTAPREALTAEQEEYTDNEAQLLEEFIDGMVGGVLEIAEEIGHPQQPKLHFYFFAEHAEETLLEALDRHNNIEICRMWRNLLDQRQGIDDDECNEQQMRSIVQSEVTDRMNVSYPSEGLLPLHDLLTSYDASASWTYTGENGQERNLTDVFERSCFDYSYDFDPCSGMAEGSRVYPDEPPIGEDGYFLPVSGSRIPVEYVWASQNRLDLDWIIEHIENPDMEVSLESIGEMLPFIYRNVGVETAEIVKEEIKAANDENDTAERIPGLNDDFDKDNYTQGLHTICDWLREERGLKLEEITEDDVEVLAEQFSNALADIEAEIDQRNYDVKKEQIRLPFCVPEEKDEYSLTRALKDYLFMEYESKRRDNFGYYWTKPVQRLRSGRSILVEVEEVETEGRHLNVTARLPYEDVDRFENPDYVLNKIRSKSSEGTTSGSWLVANPVRNHNDVLPTLHNDSVNKDRKYARKASYIEQGAKVSIRKMDIPNRKISFNAYGTMQGDNFSIVHRNAVGPDEDDLGGWDVPFEPGDWFILDPSHDDITAAREYEFLNDSNNLLTITEDMVNDRNPSLSSSFFNSGAEEDVIGFLNEQLSFASHRKPVPPNTRQKKFIKGTGSFINLLQGPPGTGKTHTLAGTLLARIYGANVQGDSCQAAVVGPSHRAVDKVVETTGNDLLYGIECGDESNEISDSGAFRNTLIIRVVTNGFEEPDDPGLPVVYMTNRFEIAGVGNVSDEVERKIEKNGLKQEVRRRLRDQTPGEHVIICGTSGGLKPVIDEMETDERDLFNIVLADEASMLRLPGIMLPGSELDTNGQLFVSGDQRQMPPVQTHSWEDETRKNIRNITPYLSTLNFYRLLKGDGIENGEFESITVDELCFTPGNDILMVQLIESYRCGDTTSSLLNADVYEKYDDIHYRTASEAERLDDDDPQLLNPDYAFSDMISRDEFTASIPPLDRSAAREILGKDTEIVLIQHEEDGSRQLNRLEIALSNAITDAANGSTTEDGYSTGIVTPHNSQRSQMQLRTNDTDWIKTDTVERFQGGEEDIIIVTATESDPDYLTSQSEFILSPNRINVALSRMKYKLIIIASKEIFELIPRDVDEYKDAELWKGIQAALREGGEAWNGSVHDLLEESYTSGLDDADVTIYTGESPGDIGLDR